jgi:peptidoglycan/xylan/chitin deacetylase (PgdA/CDA1 family)
MKHLFLRILYHLGLVRLWCFLRRNKITILTLHGVMDRGIPSVWEPLRPRTSRQLFDETLSLAVKYFNFVSIDEAVDMLKGVAPIKKNSCVITFDDGQLNNVQLALPILRKYRIPVVFYPTTGVLERRVPYWFDRLDYAIQQPGLDGLKLNIGTAEVKIDQSSRERMACSLSKLIKSLKSKVQSDARFQAEVLELSSYLEQVSGKGLRDVKEVDLWSSAMSKQEIVDCAGMADVTLGSHTVNHVRLPFADEEERDRELRDSKSTLERLTGKPCLHFCYPNGDWNDSSAIAVEAAGYVTAVTTDTGCNEVGDNLYTLKRYSFPGQGTPLKALFAITGMLHFFSEIRSSKHDS